MRRESLLSFRVILPSGVDASALLPFAIRRLGTVYHTGAYLKGKPIWSGPRQWLKLNSDGQYVPVEAPSAAQ